MSCARELTRERRVSRRHVLTPGVRSHGIGSGRAPVLVGGAVIAAINVTMAALGLDTGTPAFMALLMAHLLVYLAVAAIVRARPAMSTNLALLCLAIGLLARLPLIALPEVSARDAIRYVWDARVQRAGLNPYQVRPDDLVVTHLHSPLTRRVDAAWLPTIYPPAAQLYFRGVTAVSESLTAFRLGAVLCDALVGLTLMTILGVTGRPRGWLLLYAWHPLLMFESAAGAHVDFAGVLALTLGYLAFVTGRPGAGTVFYMVAVLVKPLPVVLLPLVWRHVRWPHMLAAAAAGALAVVAVTGGRVSPGSLGAFVDHFRFNGPAFSLLEVFAPPRIVAAAALVAGLAIALRYRLGAPGRPEAWAWPMAGALCLAPVIYPWYVVWFIPFLVLRTVPALWVWSLTILSIYPVWHLAAPGGTFEVPPPLLAVEFGLPLLTMGAMSAEARWRSRP